MHTRSTPEMQRFAAYDADFDFDALAAEYGVVDAPAAPPPQPQPLFAQASSSRVAWTAQRAEPASPAPTLSAPSWQLTLRSLRCARLGTPAVLSSRIVARASIRLRDGEAYMRPLLVRPSLLRLRSSRAASRALRRCAHPLLQRRMACSSSR